MARYNLEDGSVQHQFFLDRGKIQMFGGGFGNGKTAALCIKCIQLAQQYPGSNGLIGRETYAKLNDTTRREYYKWVPKDSVQRWPSKDDNTLIFKNGSVVNFRYVAQRGKKSEEGDTTSNLLSATYDYVAIDQVEDPMITYKDFLDLHGRLRGTTPYRGNDPTMPMSGPRWMILNCNPTANWVWKRLVRPIKNYLITKVVTDDLMVDPDTLEPMIHLFEDSTYGNKHNLPEDFIKTIATLYRGQMFDRFVMGKWASYEGLVYPDYSSEINCIPKQHMMDILLNDFGQRRRMDRRYKGIQAFDHGISKPSCYLLGFIDEVGRIFWLDGFYQPGLTTTKLVERIGTLQALYDNLIDFDDPIWADPAIFKKTQVVGETITTVGKELSNKGLYIKPGQNDIKSGITKVSGYLAPIDGFHYLDNTKPGPGMYFSNELGFIDEEFTSYFWKKNELGDTVDTPMDRNDHAMDAIKFAVSRLPDPSELLFVQPPINPRYLQWQEAR